MQVNTKEETPLHIAARYGHASIVKQLIQHAKEDHPDHNQHHESRGAEAAKKMLRMASKEGDTALHEAVRFRHLNVVRILIDEDGHFQHNANKSGETPLYMAVERGYDQIAYEILEHCNSPAIGGPNDRNVLHAAAIRNDQGILTFLMVFSHNKLCCFIICTAKKKKKLVFSHKKCGRHVITKSTLYFL